MVGEVNPFAKNYPWNDLSMEMNGVSNELTLQEDLKSDASAFANTIGAPELAALLVSHKSLMAWRERDKSWRSIGRTFAKREDAVMVLSEMAQLSSELVLTADPYDALTGDMLSKAKIKGSDAECKLGQMITEVFTAQRVRRLTREITCG